MTDTVETIVAAAVQFETPEPFASQMWRGKQQYPALITVTAPPPARHGSLLHPMTGVTGKDICGRRQGFITSTGRYVNRLNAFRIAMRAGQTFLRGDTDEPRDLFSEDLW